MSFLGDHPLFADNDGQACRVCGCTEHNACFSPGRGACAWAEPDLCTHCAAPAAAVIAEEALPPDAALLALAVLAVALAALVRWGSLLPQVF